MLWTASSLKKSITVSVTLRSWNTMLLFKNFLLAHLSLSRAHLFNYSRLKAEPGSVFSVPTEPKTKFQLTVGTLGKSSSTTISKFHVRLFVSSSQSIHHLPSQGRKTKEGKAFKWKKQDLNPGYPNPSCTTLGCLLSPGTLSVNVH